MSPLIPFGEYVLETTPLVLKRGKEVIKLPPRQIETLALLVEASGAPVAKQTFLEQVWGGAYVEEANLTQTVFLLRRLLGKLPCGEEYIETLPRHGYRLAAAACVQSPEKVEVSAGPLPQDDPAEVEPSSPQDFDGSAASEGVPVSVTPAPGRGGPASASITRGKWRPLLSTALVLLTLAAVSIFSLAPWEKPRVLRITRLTNDGAYKEVLAPLLSDEARVFFTEIVGNANYLAEVSPLGGMVSRHLMPSAGASAAALSKFHEGLLFNSTWDQGDDHLLTLQSPANGAARRIGDLHAHSAAWSPDGQALAFTVGHTLMMTDTTGSQTRLLAEFPDVPFWPAWSPDGRRIRFSRTASGLREGLWELSVSDKGLRPVNAAGPHEHNACCGSWSQDGRYFVYMVEDAHTSSIWARRESRIAGLLGSHRESVVADGPMDFWRSPLISQDGKHMFAVGEQARGELNRYDGATQTFTPIMPGLSADTISFSRDGKWMTYSLFPEGTVWRSRADGTEKLQLSKPGQFARFPQWSPDGRSVVYMATQPGGVWTDRLVSSNGGPSRPVLDDGSSQGVATFSPDGQQIAFGRIAVYGTIPGNIRGITIVRLGSGSAETIPGSEGLWTARWSPTGEFLAATTLDRQKLMLYEFHTGQWVELFSEGVNDVVWGRDGKELFFDSPNGSKPLIYRVELKDRSVHPYAALGELQRTGFYGWQLSLSAANEVIVLKQAGIVEVYRLDVELP